MSASNFSVTTLPAPGSPSIPQTSIAGVSEFPKAGKAAAPCCNDKLDSGCCAQSTANEASRGLDAATDPFLAKFAASVDPGWVDDAIDEWLDRTSFQTAVVRPMSRGDVSASLSALTNAVIESGTSIDVHALVQWVIREAYIESNADLLHYADKVRFFNKQKQVLRAHISKVDKILVLFADVKDEDRAKTTLNKRGVPTGQTEAYQATRPQQGVESSGERPAKPADKTKTQTVGGRVLKPSEERGAVVTFDSYKGNLVWFRTDLEDAIINNPALKDELIKALPYMDEGTLRRVLSALGGSDMSVDEGAKDGLLRGIWDAVFDNLTAQQIGWLEGNTQVGKFDWVAYGEALVTEGGAKSPFEIARGKAANVRNSQNDADTTYNNQLADYDARQKRIEEAKNANAQVAQENKNIESQNLATKQRNDASLAELENFKAGVQAATVAVDTDQTDGSISAVTFNKGTATLVAAGAITNVAQLDEEKEKLERLLNTIGDDAQLANVELQNMLQRQQQTLQMLSNLAKNSHDTAMAIIRNMGG